ncbi:NfeD family protein [Porticoccus litoralis]|uniref:NfeD family protein n=1 Tax=Porticoccus litoralis TaxID=434086 RepID=A0AAW8B3T6_9GAMM|nr:NfeD family protein [Porticoccus litoralis]MDP1521087.1 NfeD family protein [Porticoccus litoralis]TNE94602.1 MAG: NfeD family protein [Gammaproteobacteria bacterium]
MEFELATWHWLVLGILLVIMEIFIPSFTVLWFGLGALVVGVTLWPLPELPLAAQLLIWIVASCLFAILWFKYFKPRMIDKTTAGIAREAAVGESGQVIKVPAGERRGVVRFAIPILSADEWEFICEQDVAVGDRVFIKEFSGNTLIVVKLD